MKKIIEYFSHQHIFSNFLYFFILIAGIFFWQITQKEELPEIAADFVRINVSYPGASPEEVERLVTWPIEKELQNVDGLEEVRSTSSEGISTIMVDLQKNSKNRNNIVTDIRNAVLSVKLPDEILEHPEIREFKSSKKAIIDVGIYFTDKKYLSISDRKKLQRIAHTLENRLINLPEINSVNKRGYLKEELQILIDPNKLNYYRLSARTVMNAINTANVRQPAGTLENHLEERITLDGELIKKKDLENLPIQGTFEGRLLYLKDIAKIKDGFERTNKVIKINGHEGVFFSVVKNSSHGILDGVDAIKKEVKLYLKQVNVKNKVNMIFFDDESKDVRNRIEIIKGNGILGFILIVSALFIFLNFRAGFWVAAGIPFTFSFTLIIANLIGYTINNMTLAAVIIVMGMVVDDAIVVSENIVRLHDEGMEMSRAVVEGTAYVLLPVTASMLTTIVAFLPLWTFEGRLAMFIQPIPTIVSLMLIASLIESLIILPAHINLTIPRWIRIAFSLGTILLIERYYEKKYESGKPQKRGSRAWFRHIENFYIRLATPVIRFAPLVILFFIIATFIAFFIMKNRMKFSLFPREEVTEVRINAEAPPGTRKYKTAKMAEKLEAVFLPYLGKEIMGMVTYVGIKHFGTNAQENVIWLRIELRDKEDREKSFRQLRKEWAPKLKKLAPLQNVRFSKRRFGMSSGSPIEIIVQDNDNTTRQKVTDALMNEMAKHPALTSIQTGDMYHTPEYTVKLRRDLLKRLEIDAAEVGTLLRSVLDGMVLYRFLVGDEEKDVRFSIPKRNKRQLQQILNIPVHNSSGYLVPLRQLVIIKKTNSPQEIQRLNRQRITRVYADFKPGVKITPLEIADYLEHKVFPKMGSVSESAIFAFDGEIKFTRESSGFFPLALTMILFFIYFILALQFQSMTRPFLILFTIPPALASVIYIFLLHGMKSYGFFGIIGGLGLAGVVVNDAIVLIKKLEDSYAEARANGQTSLSSLELAQISATRLRAVLLTTITTVAGLFPTAYGVMGYDSMLAEMMLALAWGLVFGTVIILYLVPSMYKILIWFERGKNNAK